MICQPCRDHQHGRCPGGTWCCCQHQNRAVPNDPAQARIDDRADNAIQRLVDAVAPANQPTPITSESPNVA